MENIFVSYETDIILGQCPRSTLPLTLFWLRRSDGQPMTVSSSVK